jgi:membrane protease subunit HflK
VTELKLQVVDPPEQVKDAFHEVVRAREDRERLINEALGYQEDVIPKARGQGEQMVRTAEAYKAQRVIRAEGDAAKFVTILKEYERAQEITEQRLYLETLQRVLPKAQKIVISPQLEGGVLPFLPLRDQAPRVLVPPGPDGKRGTAENAPSTQTVPQPGRAVR